MMSQILAVFCKRQFITKNVTDFQKFPFFFFFFLMGCHVLNLAALWERLSRPWPRLQSFLKLVIASEASLVAQRVKRLPARWETRVQSLGWEDPWRRKWQPTPVLLPGKSHGWRSLAGYSPWGHKESDTTEQLHFHFL